jgi:transcriptional regulator with XRE-family HTH domain
MNRIKEIRERQGLSQAKLGALVGTSQAEISRLENEERELTESWMRRIAVALGVHPADLIAAAELTDDVEPYFPSADADLAAPLRKHGLAYWRVKTDVVSLTGINRDAIVLVDASEESIAARKSGDILLIQATQVGEDKRTVRVLRQFIEPMSLMTNRPGRNAIFGLDETDFGVEIKGVVTRP